MNLILDVLRGIRLNPVLTGIARGIAEGVAFLVLYALMDAVASGQLSDQVGQFGPIILVLMRSAEGILDKIDPAKQRQRDAVRQDPGAPSVG